MNAEPDATMLEALHEEAEKVKAVPGRTRYEIQVLVEDAGDAPQAWMPVAEVEASGARAAMYMVANGSGYNIAAGDTLRAVPVRNITQLKLDVETTTKLRLS